MLNSRLILYFWKRDREIDFVSCLSSRSDSTPLMVAIHFQKYFQSMFFVRRENQIDYSNYVFMIQYLHSMPLAYYITNYNTTFIPGVLQCFLFW